jgi:CRP-like cAMP-binding protein
VRQPLPSPECLEPLGFRAVRGIRHDTKVEALRSSCLFEEMPKKHLTELARRSEDMDVAAGKVLVKEGGTGNEFFVIVDGEAEVTRKGKRIATRGPGEFFGEMALLEDVPRTATVTAKTPLRFFVLTRQSFLRLLDDEPTVERKVLRALARRALASDA